MSQVARYVKMLFLLNLLNLTKFFSASIMTVHFGAQPFGGMFCELAAYSETIAAIALITASISEALVISVMAVSN